jgi:hypothetical protein
MSHQAFIDAFKVWLNQGMAACDVDGTLTQIETVKMDTAWTQHKIDYRLEQDATRTVTVTLSGGQFRSNADVTGKTTTTQIQHGTNPQGLPCTVTSVTIEKYWGTTSGLATVQVTDTAFFTSTVSHNTFQKNQPPLMDYRIDVTLPPENTENSITNTVADLCGAGLGPSPPHSEKFTWPDWTFTLEGQALDPKSKRLLGACDKEVKWEDVRSTRIENDVFQCNRFAGIGNSVGPWLPDHGAAGSFWNATGIPFRVVTTWNITYRP